MLPNAYTKKEILGILASKGQFVDSYTLDSFFEKWQVEAIFEDEKGQEFYDKNTLDFVCEKLFNSGVQQAENAEINLSQSMANNSSEQQILNNAPQMELKIDGEIDISGNNSSNIQQIQPVIQNQSIRPTAQQQAPPTTVQNFSNQPVSMENQYAINQQPVKPVPNSYVETSQPAVNSANFAYNQPQQNQMYGAQQYQNVQPAIQQPQPAPQIPQYQSNIPNAQIPYGGQQQYQNMPYQQNAPFPQNTSYQQNMPYQQNSQVQQPYMQYNSFQNNSFPQQNIQMPQQSIQQNSFRQNNASEISLSDEFSISDPQTSQILNSISLSDGNPLINRIKSDTGMKDYTGGSAPGDLSDEEILKPLKSEKSAKTGVLGGAMEAAGITELDSTQDPVSAAADAPDIDDISLLSESMEAQEKLREYVVSELAKKNVDLTPQSNEFKLDISERTVNMIARTVAKKIAKNVTSILSNELKSTPQATALKEENEKLTKKTQELEDENKKLRLLLVESNKNINSFKSIFGLFYIKVKPKAKKNAKQNKDTKSKK